MPRKIKIRKALSGEKVACPELWLDLIKIVWIVCIIPQPEKR